MTVAVDESQVVEEALKTLGEPVKLMDLVELTKDRVQWGVQKNRTGKIRMFMKERPTIKKVGFGLYEYDHTNVEEQKPNENIDQILMELPDKDKNLLEGFRNVAKPDFTKPKRKIKAGDLVEGKVTGIEEYGVFVNDDSGEIRGLIHITNVSRKLVDDINRHFKVGDTVKAKVLSAKHDGKLALSTKDVELPDYFKGESMTQIRVVQKIEKPKQEVKTEAPKKDNYDDVYKHVQSVVGIVSDDAKTAINEIVDEVGMFKFAMALSKVSDNFNVDVSMLFVEEVKKKMNGGL